MGLLGRAMGGDVQGAADDALSTSVAHLGPVKSKCLPFMSCHLSLTLSTCLRVAVKALIFLFYHNRPNSILLNECAMH